MAQILAPSMHWQMSMLKNSNIASPMTTKTWGSLLKKQNKKGTTRTSAKFRVLALKSDNSTVNRIEDLLNLDITPYTDNIITEYIWLLGRPASSFEDGPLRSDLLTGRNYNPVGAHTRS